MFWLSKSDWYIEQRFDKMVFFFHYNTDLNKTLVQLTNPVNAIHGEHQ